MAIKINNMLMIEESSELYSLQRGYNVMAMNNKTTRTIGLNKYEKVFFGLIAKKVDSEAITQSDRRFKEFDKKLLEAGL